jgi:hypothetical protein
LARSAKEIGLVLDVFDETLFMAKALDLARRIASMPHDAVVQNRRVINHAVDVMGLQRATGQRRRPEYRDETDRRKARAAMGCPVHQGAEGWAKYKKARDDPFDQAWLDY